MPTQPGRSLARVAPIFFVVAGLGTLQLVSTASPAAAGIGPSGAPAPAAAASAPRLDTDALGAINAARRGEGVRPMVLPTNFDSLSSPQQLLVVTDLERVDRSLPPVVGLTPTLDALAQNGAAACCDPQGPAGYAWQSNWEQGAPSALAADYEWMYNDGPGGVNAGCPPKCWGHRNNILGPGGKMGAGASGSALTELFVQGYPEPPSFTWSQEVPYLHIGAAFNQLAVSSAPRTSNAVTELINNPASLMLVTAALSGGPQWRLGRSSCWSGPGIACPIVVVFSPGAPGIYLATLTVAWPGGRQQIPVRGLSGDGYWEVARDGGVFDFGGGGYRGSTGAIRLNAPIVAAVATPDHGGYWLAARDGGIFTFGDARYFGSAARTPLAAPIVAMAATPSGRGYWLAGSDGGIFTFGDARYHGTTARGLLAAPIVAMAATSSGRGYWLMASDGGVFTFGDARFLGSAARTVTDPITAAATTPDGQGYWLAGSDGNVYRFGRARYFGSTRGVRLNQPVVAILADRSTGGYWLIATDGGVFSFHAPYLGGMGGKHINQPVIGAAAS